MQRSKKEIQDAVALLKAMTVVVNMQGNQHLFGNALNTIQAAISEIVVSHPAGEDDEAWSFPRGEDDDNV